MARTKAPKNQVVAMQEHNRNAILPLDSVPDYLKDTTSTGLEGLGKDDFKIPRIKLLQALNPEVRSFQGQAIPGEFWHTGANTSLGSEFLFVPILAGKRVILWDPNEGKQGGDILAFSRNGLDWQTGGDKEFKVTLKGGKNVVWHTKKNVLQSKLDDWGSSDPEENNSPPAATLIYEYLCYLPDHAELSPCVMGAFRTALPNAKRFNTDLFMRRKPTASLAVRCFADEKTEGKLAWFVPQFKLAGFVSDELYAVTSKLGEKYAEYTAEYDKTETQTDAASTQDDGKY